MGFSNIGFTGGKGGTSGGGEGTPTPLSSVLNSESTTTAATSRAAKELNDKIGILNQRVLEDKTEISSEIQGVTSQLAQSLQRLGNLESIKVMHVDSMINSGMSMSDIVTEINNASGRSVFKFGAGTYVFSNQLNLKARVILKGEGRTSTSLRYLGTDPIAVLMEDSDGSGLVDLTLTGNQLSGQSSTADGVVIRKVAMSQTGSQQLKGIAIEQFKNGLSIGGSVFTVNCKDTRITNCTEYGLYNVGTDNQFSDVVSVGCKFGQYLGGYNNVYNNFYCIYEGTATTRPSAIFTGGRHYIQGFTCQDNRSPIEFRDFNGHFYGFFDGNDTTVRQKCYVELINSTVYGSLALYSYQGGHQVDRSVYIDAKSTFVGDIFSSASVTASIKNDGILRGSLDGTLVANPYQYLRNNLGFDYNYNSASDVMSISRNGSYGSSTFRNSIMPEPNKTWVFSGEARVVNGSNGKTIRVFNDSGIEPAYQAKTIARLASEWVSFYVAVHRHTNNVGLSVEGMDSDLNEVVEIRNLKAYDVTDKVIKYAWSHPSYLNSLK